MALSGTSEMSQLETSRAPFESAVAGAPSGFRRVVDRGSQGRDPPAPSTGRRAPEWAWPADRGAARRAGRRRGSYLARASEMGTRDGPDRAGGSSGGRRHNRDPTFLLGGKG
jgi:hypothetical protein